MSGFIFDVCIWMDVSCHLIITGHDVNEGRAVTETVDLLRQFKTFFNPGTIARRLKYAALAGTLHTYQYIYLSKLKVRIANRTEILYDQVSHIVGHFNQLILLNYSLQSPELTYKNNKKKFQPYHLVVQSESPERNDVALGELDVIFHIIPYSHLIIEERFPHVSDIGFSA